MDVNNCTLWEEDEITGTKQWFLAAYLLGHSLRLLGALLVLLVGLPHSSHKVFHCLTQYPMNMHNTHTHSQGNGNLHLTMLGIVKLDIRNSMDIAGGQTD